MTNNKPMTAILHTGEVVEINKKSVFDNQYITKGGSRIFDYQIKRIDNDIRLDNFFECSDQFKGTAEECKDHIKSEQKKIKNCQGCFWCSHYERIPDKCTKAEEVNGDIVTIKETTTYKKSCSYMPKHGDKCAHDISEEITPYKDKHFCFFVKYPDGLPLDDDFVLFVEKMARKIAEKSGQQVSVFGSYRFTVEKGGVYDDNSFKGLFFRLANCKRKINFIYDKEKSTFVQWYKHDYSYKIKSLLTEQYSETALKLPKFYEFFKNCVSEYYKRAENEG